nr:carboxypeptidase regulatory-like domain-containing protein [Deltaproteobacteria bacterium]
MNKLIQTVMAGALLAGGASLIELPDAYAQGSATVGTLRGVIRDKASGEAAVGATVVATSPSLQGEQVVITEDGGQYFITSLPPGLYVLTVYYNDATFSRGNVVIQIGKEAVVNVTVDSGAATGRPKGEVIEISGSAPIVDQGSTKLGLTLTDDYTRNIPTSRTFGGVVGQAAGAQTDLYGISFAGATSAENTYIVEGINTTDTGFGGLSSNLPNEFIAETEVITGGYNAEFGRATGGIVNVVTKQGSNEFRGSVFGYFQPGALVSEAKIVQREGGSIDSRTDLDYRYDFGAELGGPIIKDKLWFHVGFNPSLSHSTTSRLVQTQVDKNSDGVPDLNDQGFTIHEPVTASEIPRDFKTYFFTAKVNGAVNQNNQFQISAFGNPRSAEDIFGLTRNPSQTRYKYKDGAYDIAGKWTSKFNQGKTQVDAVVGYHHGFTNDSPFSADQDVPTVFYNYERSLYDFADLEGMGQISKCQDGGPDDPYPMIRNCPVTAYTTQGLALIEEKVNARKSAAVSVTQRVKLAGYHVFKAGLDAEFATYVNDVRYSGGARYRRSANTATGAPGRWQLREYFKYTRNLTDAELMDPSSVTLQPGQSLCANDQAVCQRAERLQADTTNRNIAAYLQDQWQIRPNFTLNLGLRYEQQVGYAAET